MVMRRPSILPLLACLGTAAVMAPSPASGAAHPTAESWLARGVIRAFGPDRKSISIAHEAIDGYMGAMTMSFEPRDAKLLAPFAVGDRVAFEFVDTDDGRRIIESITRR